MALISSASRRPAAILFIYQLGAVLSAPPTTSIRAELVLRAVRARRGAEFLAAAAARAAAGHRAGPRPPVSRERNDGRAGLRLRPAAAPVLAGRRAGAAGDAAERVAQPGAGAGGRRRARTACARRPCGWAWRVPIEAGRFRSLDGGRTVVYARTADASGELRDVFIKRGSGRAVEVTTVRAARRTVFGRTASARPSCCSTASGIEGVPGTRAASLRALRRAAACR